MEYIIFAVILVVTVVIVLFLMNRQMQVARKEYEERTEAKERETERRLSQERAEMEQRLAAQQREMEQRVAAQQREMEDRLRLQASKAEEQIRQQQSKSEEQSRIYFRSIAQDVLKQQSDSLKSQNNEMIAMVLDPVKTKLEEFSKTVSDSYVKETAARQSLCDQIDRLIKLNSDIGQEARNLTSALKGDSKVQGDWGEMVLQTLLESAGMVEGQNFFTQVTRDETQRTLTDDEGNRMRPDVVVNLPDDHKMVIDSKVSLKAYTEYMSATDDLSRQEAGKRHIRSVTSHIDELGDKQYQKVIKKAADHVMMFIPNEGAYYAAMQLNPDLWKYAYDRNVVMVSPTHLFSVMQIVAQLWQQDRQNKYALEIAKAGGELYDKFATFYQHFLDIEKEMNDVSKKFDRCRQDIENRQGMIAKAHKLRDLGASATKMLPE